MNAENFGRGLRKREGKSLLRQPKDQRRVKLVAIDYSRLGENWLDRAMFLYQEEWVLAYRILIFGCSSPPSIPNLT